jgi:recombination protein RecT
MSNQVALASPKELLAFLTKSRSAIEMALPKHLNPDRMLRLALTCWSTTPKLRQCSGQSILASIVVASQLGLEPGIAGQAYLIPYKGTCTLVPGWQGLVGLLNNTGRATAWTGSVFEGDTWEFELGSAPKLRHIPGPNYGDPDKMTWAYACGKVNGSEQPVVEAWPVGRIIKHRDKFNQVGRQHYSYDNFEMYARKVVLLQVLKYMPRSIELNNAITAADAGEMGRATTVDAGVVIEVEPAQVEDGNRPQQEVPVETTAPRATPQKELEEFVVGAGFDFDTFQRFAMEGGGVNNADTLTGFSEVSTDDARRLLRGKAKLPELLALAKNGGAK